MIGIFGSYLPLDIMDRSYEQLRMPFTCTHVETAKLTFYISIYYDSIANHIENWGS